IPIICIYIGLHVMIKREWPRRWSARKTGIVLFILGLAIMSHMSMFKQMDPGQMLTDAPFIISKTFDALLEGVEPSGFGILTHEVGGGMIGALLYGSLYFLFDNVGASVVQYTLFIL